MLASYLTTLFRAHRHTFQVWYHTPCAYRQDENVGKADSGGLVPVRACCNMPLPHVLIRRFITTWPLLSTFPPRIRRDRRTFAGLRSVGELLEYGPKSSYPSSS